ncbi:MAG TPA: LuxR C-terminal-related transcriptional regulator [Vicinamibacterales bacterium]|jgi:DNA-binding NarL/FixJ family response regulator
MSAPTRVPTRRFSTPPDWRTEYAELSTRDRRTPLPQADLERLGVAAYMSGDEAASIDALTRAHNVALANRDVPQAARSAFWVAFALIGARELTRAGGWAARAQRLLEEHQCDSVECGYVRLPQALQQVAAGDLPGAAATFAGIERIGERFGDTDLVGLARHGRGRALVGMGHIAAGLSLLDEVMVSVTAGEVTPIVSGVIYCSVISACFELLDMRRAQEWTEALNGWCERQSGLVPYRGECLTHRADLLRLRGRWAEALDEAQRAYEAQAALRRGEGGTAYVIAELQRLRGNAAEAEAAYRTAAEHGRTPQPGLSLLRLAQGQRDLARASIERALAEPSRGRQRADLLAAAVEILLASGAVNDARQPAEELTIIAASNPSAWLRAMAATAEGAVLVSARQPREALTPLREAVTIWGDLDAPYEAARVRLLVGRACQALGDRDGAQIELDAAARVFRAFGAAPALAALERLEADRGAAAATPPGGLTAREVEVLKLMAQGKTNRAIARELDISEKTVARHVSNIFVKLDLSSRAAATAYAFTHRLAP